MTDETFPHEIWADLDHWIEGPAASDLRAQGYMKYIRADRIEELEAKLAKSEAEKFTVGTLTMKHVFRPSGLTNVSDMQAVFDATERGFEELEAKLAKAVEALRRISNMPHSDTCSQELCFAFHCCDCHVAESREALAELTGGKDG